MTYMYSFSLLRTALTDKKPYIVKDIRVFCQNFRNLNTLFFWNLKTQHQYNCYAEICVIRNQREALWEPNLQCSPVNVFPDLGPVVIDFSDWLVP